MKKTALIVSALMMASINPVMANCPEHEGNHTAATDHADHKEDSTKQKPNPMVMLMGKTSPMPVFMPIMVKNSEELGLSKEQQDELAKWRTDNMASALALAKEIIDGDKAIKQAALDNKPTQEVEAMIASVLEKRSTMATTMLRCRENSKRILTESQWEQVTKMYREKQQHNHTH
jgi:hypothetical protein